MGHSDGALLALLATALAVESNLGGGSRGSRLNVDSGLPFIDGGVPNIRQSPQQGVVLASGGGIPESDMPSSHLLRTQSEPAARLLAAANGGGEIEGGPARHHGGRHTRDMRRAPDAQAFPSRAGHGEPGDAAAAEQSEAGGSTEPSTPDSRSRGACLVPRSWTTCRLCDLNCRGRLHAPVLPGIPCSCG